MASVTAQVILLDGKLLEVPIDRKAKGEELMDKVCAHLNLIEKEYFGLVYEEKGGEPRNWLELDKRMAKFFKGTPWKMNFEVKFYPPDPSQLQEDITRYHLCLQVRNDILSGKLGCSFVTHAMLGSYLVQSELGDYDSEEHSDPSYLKGFTFAPEQTPELVTKVMELHKTHKGQTPAEAEIHYLENAKKLAMYGVDLHPAKDSENVDISIGVCSTGLSVYRERLRMNRFPWPKILKIAYRRNHFFIKIRPGDYDQVESTIGFKCASHKAAKRLWKTAVEYHTFFRLMSPDAVTKPGILPKLSSSFSYRQKTHYQTKQRNIDREQPAFARTLSTYVPSRSMDPLTQQKDVNKDATKRHTMPYPPSRVPGLDSPHSKTDKKPAGAVQVLPVPDRIKEKKSKSKNGPSQESDEEKENRKISVEGGSTPEKKSKSKSSGGFFSKSPSKSKNDTSGVTLEYEYDAKSGKNQSGESGRGSSKKGFSYEKQLTRSSNGLDDSHPGSLENGNEDGGEEKKTAIAFNYSPTKDSSGFSSLFKKKEKEHKEKDTSVSSESGGDHRGSKSKLTALFGSESGKKDAGAHEGGGTGQKDHEEKSSSGKKKFGDLFKSRKSDTESHEEEKDKSKKRSSLSRKGSGGSDGEGSLKRESRDSRKHQKPADSSSPVSETSRDLDSSGQSGIVESVIVKSSTGSKKDKTSGSDTSSSKSPVGRKKDESKDGGGGGWGKGFLSSLGSSKKDKNKEADEESPKKGSAAGGRKDKDDESPKKGAGIAGKKDKDDENSKKGSGTGKKDKDDDNSKKGSGTGKKDKDEENSKKGSQTGKKDKENDASSKKLADVKKDKDDESSKKSSSSKKKDKDKTNDDISGGTVGETTIESEKGDSKKNKSSKPYGSLLSGDLLSSKSKKDKDQESASARDKSTVVASSPSDTKSEDPSQHKATSPKSKLASLFGRSKDKSSPKLDQQRTESTAATAKSSSPTVDPSGDFIRMESEALNKSGSASLTPGAGGSVAPGPKIIKTTTKSSVVKDKGGNLTQEIEEKVEDVNTGDYTVNTQTNTAKSLEEGNPYVSATAVTTRTAMTTEHLESNAKTSQVEEKTVARTTTHSGTRQEQRVVTQEVRATSTVVSAEPQGERRDSLSSTSSDDSGTPIDGDGGVYYTDYKEPIVETEAVILEGPESDAQTGLVTTTEVPLVSTSPLVVSKDAAYTLSGEIVSTQTITSKTRTVETVTYKTEKDGVVETRVEQKITIQSDGDPLDHDKALAEAIQEATAMNPDMHVEKIEIQQESLP